MAALGFAITSGVEPMLDPAADSPQNLAPFALRMLAALAVATLALTPSPADVFDELVVFGDSLSDTGNASCFSNGPVWVEGVANSLGLSARPSEMGGTNYAIGGARLDPASGPTSLPAQLQRHLEGNRLPRKRLYIVYGGGNDLIAAGWVAPEGSWLTVP
jgi:phospholipase/lecithinase/hemolysin